MIPVTGQRMICASSCPPAMPVQWWGMRRLVDTFSRRPSWASWFGGSSQQSAHLDGGPGQQRRLFGLGDVDHLRGGGVRAAFLGVLVRRLIAAVRASRWWAGPTTPPLRPRRNPASSSTAAVPDRESVGAVGRPSSKPGRARGAQAVPPGRQQHAKPSLVEHRGRTRQGIGRRRRPSELQARTGTRCPGPDVSGSAWRPMRTECRSGSPGAAGPVSPVHPQLAVEGRRDPQQSRCQRISVAANADRMSLRIPGGSWASVACASATGRLAQPQSGPDQSQRQKAQRESQQHRAAHVAHATAAASNDPLVGRLAQPQSGPDQSQRQKAQRESQQHRAAHVAHAIEASSARRSPQVRGQAPARRRRHVRSRAAGAEARSQPSCVRPLIEASSARRSPQVRGQAPARRRRHVRSRAAGAEACSMLRFPPQPCWSRGPATKSAMTYLAISYNCQTTPCHRYGCGRCSMLRFPPQPCWSRGPATKSAMTYLAISYNCQTAAR